MPRPIPIPRQLFEGAVIKHNPRIVVVEKQLRKAQANGAPSYITEELENELYTLKEFEEAEKNRVEQIQARRAIDLGIAYRWDGRTAFETLNETYAEEDAAEEESLRQARERAQEEEEARTREETALLEQFQRVSLGAPQETPRQRRASDHGPGYRTFDRLNARLRRALNEGDRDEVQQLRDELAAFTEQMQPAIRAWRTETMGLREPEEDPWGRVEIQDVDDDAESYEFDDGDYGDYDTESDHGYDPQEDEFSHGDDQPQETVQWQPLEDDDVVEQDPSIPYYGPPYYGRSDQGDYPPDEGDGDEDDQSQEFVQADVPPGEYYGYFEQNRQFSSSGTTTAAGEGAGDQDDFDADGHQLGDDGNQGGHADDDAQQSDEPE
ncbi:MAG: hypothetical protein M1836_001721 [Candelina mexicana]|nr:MAG: hypothetical protein M1836_001721 [Candelina mexicana]